MSYNKGFIASALIFAGLVFLSVPRVTQGERFWQLPPDGPAAEYGNLLMNRTSEKNGQKPVIFSHWLHRAKFTCRVCHFELEFNMKVNTTEITERTNLAGLHCGAPSCHDGKASFGHQEPHCGKCHTGSRASGSEKFSELAASLPNSQYGNGVNWGKALQKGLIKPVHYISIKPPQDMAFKERLLLESEWLNVPHAVFPHRAHIKWLDCNNCHPDIFNIKKKTTKHFTMMRILNGEFCGVCHMTVAFPMGDCRTCHPGMKE